LTHYYTRNPQNNIVPVFGRETPKQFYQVFNAKPITRVEFHFYLYLIPITLQQSLYHLYPVSDAKPANNIAPGLNTNPKPTTFFTRFLIRNPKPTTFFTRFLIRNPKSTTFYTRFLIRNPYWYMQYFNPFLLLLDCYVTNTNPSAPAA